MKTTQQGSTDALLPRDPVYAECWVCSRPMDGKSEDDCHCFHRKEFAKSASPPQSADDQTHE